MPRSSSPLSVTGFVNIAKPADMTSSDAVCIVRGVLSRRIGGRQKTGHLGTLDPLAEGVLPIALGKATALFDFLAFKTKEYIARFTFGRTTDTLDRGGVFLADEGRVPTEDELKAALPRFFGDVMQVPPAYSAKSVDGKRAYDLARKGVMPELAARPVHIESIELLASNGAEFTLRIVCGGGTYIRALARGHRGGTRHGRVHVRAHAHPLRDVHPRGRGDDGRFQGGAGGAHHPRRSRPRRASPPRPRP